MFACLECGKKFRTDAAARRAAWSGCPTCGGLDIDLDVPSRETAELGRAWREEECGGAYDGIGTVYSDADPGL